MRSGSVLSTRVCPYRVWSTSPAQYVDAFTNLGALKTPQLRDFHGHSAMQARLMINQSAVPLPSPEDGGGAESFKLLIEVGCFW